MRQKKPWGQRREAARVRAVDAGTRTTTLAVLSQLRRPRGAISAALALAAANTIVDGSTVTVVASGVLSAMVTASVGGTERRI